MPPEEPNNLVALWLNDENGKLVCRGERVFAAQGKLKVSWYTATKSTPENYASILGGVIFAYKDSVKDVVQVDQFQPTKMGDLYRWRDQAPKNGLMIALVLPEGQTLAKWDPQLEEAKRLDDRVAVYWLLYPPSESKPTVNVSWSLANSNQDLDSEAERINRAIFLSHKREISTDYDVALSFAGEDREYVDAVSDALTSAGVSVFYDKLEEANLWGSNLYNHLSEVYLKRARYTVMFISHWYVEKRWTNFERESAQARALMESKEYILPVRFDDTEIPGMPPTIHYVSANERSPKEIAGLILQKLESDSS
jgi:hypothetical protein